MVKQYELNKMYILLYILLSIISISFSTTQNILTIIIRN